MPAPPDAGFGGAVPRDGVAGGPGYVAVGTISPCCADASFDDGPWRAVVWTSTDATTWELVDDLESFGPAGLLAIAERDGTLVAVGYEVLPPPDDDPLGPLYAMRGTVWQSTNGVDWTSVSGLDGEFTDVAATPWGWVVAGSVDGVPVAWTSTDLRSWEDHRFTGETMGQDRLVMDGAGRVMSVGCVVDDRLVSGCSVATRVSATGEEWTTGTAAGLVQLSAAAAVDGRFVLLGPDMGPSTAWWDSADGVTWTARGHLPAPAAALAAVGVGGNIVVAGDRVVAGDGEPAVWVSNDGAEWSDGPSLAAANAAGTGQARVLIVDAGLVIVLGSAFVDGGGRPVAWVGRL